MPHVLAMHAQLVGAPRQRHQFQPSGLFIHFVNHAVQRHGGLAVLFIDAHGFAAEFPRRFQQFGGDPPLFDFRRSEHQSPVNLFGFARTESVGQLGGRGGRAPQNQNAAGVLVQPVNQTGIFILVETQCRQHPVQMPRHPRSALNGQPRGFVQNQNVVILVNHQTLDESGVFVADLHGVAARFGRCHRRPFFRQRRHAHDLSRGHALRRFGALAVHLDLLGAQQLLQLPLRHLRVMPPEPPVQTDDAVVFADRDHTNACHFRFPFSICPNTRSV